MNQREGKWLLERVKQYENKGKKELPNIFTPQLT